MTPGILAKPEGLYYISQQLLNAPPEFFTSREASRYLAALEVLAGYARAPQKLGVAPRIADKTIP